ncbi:type II toxin-antitoxin system VapC family toxin [Aquisalimonas lutea]|uniref:type II toxin-antitoxin system VapC family toxin n=1 Tax=Aquisalimonas lutea TaxID=1327750 RepID=UPI0025B51BAB|nr:type II toxin-antitoxin system VapC family toxin [Aquisalimonas lutea]MDN3517847.1 type II toxin-antitoxin system VapC family toxin [Aquisalimonas lutea]
MLVDTDVLIWNLRGNERAAQVLDEQEALAFSAVTYMELVQGLRNKDEFRRLRQAIRYWHATIIHVDASTSARASFLMEEHALSDSLQVADALIAATALETGCELLTGNVKHYRKLPGVSLQAFRP